MFQHLVKQIILMIDSLSAREICMHFAKQYNVRQLPLMHLK